MRLVVIGLAIGAAASVAGHGAVTHPPPRNAIDHAEAPWRNPVRLLYLSSLLLQHFIKGRNQAKRSTLTTACSILSRLTLSYMLCCIRLIATMIV